MNNTLLKGICEELEFETEISDYHVSNFAFDEGRMNIAIADLNDDLNVIHVDVRLGKLKDKDNVCISVKYKKSVWNKLFTTYGELIDNRDEVIKFLKNCAVQVIKTI